MAENKLINIDPKIGLRFMVYKIEHGAQGYIVYDRRENMIVWGPVSKDKAQLVAAQKNDSLATP